MANKQHFEVQSTKPQAKLVFGTFVGNATSSPTVVSGSIASVSRSGVGTLVITLTDAYTEFLGADFTVVGPTGLMVDVTAQNLSTPSISIQLKNGAGTATDATTSDTVYLVLKARNGG